MSEESLIWIYERIEGHFEGCSEETIENAFQLMKKWKLDDLSHE